MQKRIGNYIVFLMAFFYGHDTLYSQERLTVKERLSEELDFGVWLESTKNVNGLYINVGKYVEINGLEEEYIDSLFRPLNLDLIFELLEDERTDWNMHVVLYYFYRRRAYQLEIDMITLSLSEWRFYAKDRDIEYWKEFLNQKAVEN